MFCAALSSPLLLPKLTWKGVIDRQSQPNLSSFFSTSHTSLALDARVCLCLIGLLLLIAPPVFTGHRKSGRSDRKADRKQVFSVVVNTEKNMPAQQREFVAQQNMPPSPTARAPGSPSAPASANGVGGQRNVVLSSAAARVTSTSDRDNNIGSVGNAPARPDISPNVGASAPSVSVSSQSLSNSNQHESARLSPAALQKQVDSDPTSTSSSLLSKMAAESSSSSMLVDQLGKGSTLSVHPPLSDNVSVTDDASSCETDDCSQTSSNSSESSNESSEEGGGGVPAQPAQQAAHKVNPATLLLPSVDTLAGERLTSVISVL